MENGDHVWGLIYCETNHNGSTSAPITAPSVAQQVELLKQTCNKHKINPADVQYVEAHGSILFSVICD